MQIHLLGLQLGNETDASIVGLNGKLKLTGGSDKSGVPMRNDIHGAARKYVLLSKGVGLQACRNWTTNKKTYARKYCFRRNLSNKL